MNTTDRIILFCFNTCFGTTKRAIVSGVILGVIAALVFPEVRMPMFLITVLFVFPLAIIYFLCTGTVGLVKWMRKPKKGGA